MPISTSWLTSPTEYTLSRRPNTQPIGEASPCADTSVDHLLTGRIVDRSGGLLTFEAESTDEARETFALNRLGRRDELGLPPDAVAVPLPPGARAAYVRSDSLVFLSGAAVRPDS